MSGNLSQHRRGEEHVGTGPGRIGTGSRVVSVLSRIMQIISAAVVAGVLGHYLHNIHDGGAGSSGRIVYAVVIAGISLLVALLLIVPMKFSFFGFPLDFLIFVCWMVAFGLLVNLSRGCNSVWFRSSWGWAWGRWWTVPVNSEQRTGHPGCGAWRAAQAWSFIGGMFWLLSAILGIIVLTRSRQKKNEEVTVEKRREESHVTSGVAPVYANENLDRPVYANDGTNRTGTGAYANDITNQTAGTAYATDTTNQTTGATYATGTTTAAGGAMYANDGKGAGGAAYTSDNTNLAGGAVDVGDNVNYTGGVAQSTVHTGGPDAVYLEQRDVHCSQCGVPRLGTKFCSGCGYQEPTKDMI